MRKLESKVKYLSALVEATKWLPTRYYDELHEALPLKSKARLKNAIAGIVEDQDVLKALKKISEKERKRRQAAAKQELRATKVLA